MKYGDIASRNDLADFLKVERKHLTYVLYKRGVENCYRSFKIPKKNGEERIINAPDDFLKPIQERLAFVLSWHLGEVRKANNIKTNISHAFEKKKSIVTNAKVHRNKRLVLNMDLEDFFTSFNFGRIQGFFEKNEYFCVPKEVATIIAQLACYKGSLPQGAPSSPIITNLICQILDYRLLRVAKKYKVDYTRYADDLTFSTNNKVFRDLQDDFVEELREVIGRAGFSINEKKTRLQLRDSRQEVTGIIVNKKLNTRLEYRKDTRAMAHRLYAHEEFILDGVVGRIDQLEGRFSFIDQLDKVNNIHARKVEEAKSTRSPGKPNHKGRTLSSREKEHQKFLFYRYFYGNEKPLIVTEGKTDVVYLRAALKKMHEDYPKLISRKRDGSFEYKVSFLRRTDKLKYFFGLEPGADAMYHLYCYYTGKEQKLQNYFKYFSDLCPSPPKSPVMLFFDNELVNDKPLKKFIGRIESSEEKKLQLENNLQCGLVEGGNLYLMTHQLVKGMAECEIEDLFEDIVLNKSVNGKVFSKDPKADNKLHFGKAKFAEQVHQHYASISFENFRPLLDAITEVVDTHKKFVRKAKRKRK